MPVYEAVAPCLAFKIRNCLCLLNNLFDVEIENKYCTWHHHFEFIFTLVNERYDL